LLLLWFKVGDAIITNDEGGLIAALEADVGD
jgi:hypothetical protein